MVKCDENTLGGKIRTARMKKHMKMKQLATQAGITPNYLGLIERGKKTPANDLAIKIANALEITPQELINGTSETCIEMKNVNTSLLLTIILNQSPDITKPMLSTLLMITEKELDDILSGKEHEWNPIWDSILCGLISRIPDGNLIEDLKTLAIFLENI